MNIKFYSGFTKRINSTKRPTGNAQLTLQGELRDPTSVEKPVIRIKNMGSASPTPYIYAYIEKFQRYYFVSDWVYEQGFWWCNLSEDYLATWKTNIGNTTAYIDRCSSESDGNIMDTQYITTTDYQFAYADITLNPDYTVYGQDPVGTAPEGCFVLGIIDNKHSSASQPGGAITYWVLTPSQMKQLTGYLLSDQFLNLIGFPAQMGVSQQMSQEMAKAFINPMQFIVSCVWYPFNYYPFAYGVEPEAITVGYWELTMAMGAGRIINRYDECAISVQATLPNHPQAQTRGEYLNFSPYSRYKLFLPPFGTLPIDTSFRRRGNRLSGMIQIDPITGAGKFLYTIYDPQNPGQHPNFPWEDAMCEEMTVSFGVPIQLAQVWNDPFHSVTEETQATMSLIGAGTSALTLNPSGVVSGMKEHMSHIANAIDYLAPQTRTTGENGSRLMIRNRPKLFAEFCPIVDEDNEEMGRPLRKKRQISTLSGFVKCFEVTVDYPCFDTEKEAVLSYLLNGFFWE